MQIVFCDTCGLRISQADLQSSAIRRVEENIVICKTCVAKEAPALVAAPHKRETVELKRPVLTADSHTPHTASHGRSTTRRATRTIHEKPTTESGRAAATPAPNNTMSTMAMTWGGAALVLVISIFLLSSGGKSETKTQAPSEPPPSPPQPVVQQRSNPTPDPTKVALVNPIPPRDPEPARITPTPPKPEVKAPEPEAVKPIEAKPIETPKEPPAEPEKPDKSALNDVSVSPAEPVKPAEPAKFVNKTDLARSNPLDKASEVDDTDTTKSKTEKTDKNDKTDKPLGEGNKKPPDAAKPKPPAYVRGKVCDLFPPDRSSRSENIPDPRNGGKGTLNVDKYDGWTYSNKDLKGFSVKDGVLSIDKQGILTLDSFPVLEYRISFEVELPKNSAVGLLVGANGAIVNMLIVTETHCLSGTWDQGKTENNIVGDNKSAKPHGVKDGWIPVQVSVHPDSVDFVAGNKPALNMKLAKTSSMAQLGFLLMGLNKNNNPTCKVRKVMLNAP